MTPRILKAVQDDPGPGDTGSVILTWTKMTVITGEGEAAPSSKTDDEVEHMKYFEHAERDRLLALYRRIMEFQRGRQGYQPHRGNDLHETGKTKGENEPFAMRSLTPWRTSGSGVAVSDRSADRPVFP